MLVIIDANILISAIIDPSSNIASMISVQIPELEFTLPEYAIEEVNSKKEKICKFSKVSPSDFENNFKLLLIHLQVLSSTLIKISDIKLATKFAGLIDKKDVTYVAFSLAFDALIWTGDIKLLRGLRRNGFKNIISTAELKQLVKGLT